MADLEKVIMGLKYCSLGECVKNKCPYHHKLPEDWNKFDCNTELARDALLAISETTNKLKLVELNRGVAKARILTYEEALRAEVCFVEEKGKENLFPAIRFKWNEKIYWFAPNLTFRCTQYGLSIKPEEYLEQIRCWTTLPTDEQREAAPWSE